MTGMRSRTYARWTVLIPFATRPAQPRYWRSAQGRGQCPASPGPVSSSAPITRPLRCPERACRFIQAGHREPAERCPSPRRCPMRGAVEQPLSPVRRSVPRHASAIVHPFRFAAGHCPSALTYLPACSHGSGRAKHGLSRQSSSLRFRGAQARPYPGSRRRIRSVVLTNHMIGEAAALCKTTSQSCSSPGQRPNGCCRTSLPQPAS